MPAQRYTIGMYNPSSPDYIYGPNRPGAGRAEATFRPWTGRSMIRDNPPNRASRQPGAQSITRVTRNNSNLPIVRRVVRR